MGVLEDIVFPDMKLGDVEYSIVERGLVKAETESYVGGSIHRWTVQGVEREIGGDA